ncbi:nickel-dependent lactate racemase [Desulfospira joergensenii]|uniref:nickel-dependent lactate racemase n=1 Tax=Desulfospira joergensenii TaxID=53329 RepID=UPI0003B5FEE1|nr:nickel-dependent lactate racemase [Desulfospira joergensenii]
MDIKLKKDHGQVRVTLPDHRIIEVIRGRDVKPLGHDSIRSIIRKGIRSGSPPDIRTRKTAVIIPDDTRLWARGDLFVPCIVESLADLGVCLDQIKIIIALGTHGEISPDRFTELAGEFCRKNVEILNSANRDKDRLVHIGKTASGTELTVTKEAWEAHHIIIFGGILHHLIAGFGGGRKYILPGIAGYDAVQQNHSLALTREGLSRPGVAQAVLQGNPVNRDMEEGAALFLKDKTSCYAAVAANGEGQIFHAAVGDIHDTFREGCARLNHACCALIPGKGDFALISAGGFRTDTQLYQATKALFNAVNAVKPGGRILFVAGCAEGTGNPVFARALKEFRASPKSLGKKLASRFDMPAYVAFRVMEILGQYKVTLVSDLDEAQTRELGFGFTRNIDGYIQDLTGRGYIIPYGENILPVSRDNRPGASF